jgi:Zn-finger nucleic acid-binding protein
MKCPRCGANLLMDDRQDVRVDDCPQCHAISVRRLELQRIIERSLPGAHIGRTTSAEVKREDERTSATHSRALPESRIPEGGDRK